MTRRVSKSRGFLIIAALSSIAVAPLLRATAGTLSDDEKAFFDKHISDVVRTEPTRIDDAGFLKVFSAPFYQVKVVIKSDFGEMNDELVVARIDDKLVPVSRPSTDGPVPSFPKLLNPDFRLKTDDDAKALQHALDIAYPIIGDDNKKAQAFKHSGNQWTLIRGLFFDDKMGYVLDVDAEGKVTSVKFMLKLPA